MSELRLRQAARALVLDPADRILYLVRTPAFEPAPGLSWDALRAEGMTAVRWWELDELEAGGARLAPRRLPALVRGLIRHGPPAEPLDVGV